MSTVKETCACGAVFEYSSANGFEVAIAASQFRAKHSICRIKQAAKATGVPSGEGSA